MKDTALDGQGEAFLNLSVVIEGKLIFTKQSPTERGGHENGGLCSPGPVALSQQSALTAGSWEPREIQSTANCGASLSRNSSAPTWLKVFHVPSDVVAHIKGSHRKPHNAPFPLTPPPPQDQGQGLSTASHRTSPTCSLDPQAPSAFSHQESEAQGAERSHSRPHHWVMAQLEPETSFHGLSRHLWRIFPKSKIRQ